jgi:long-subunit acyl-CoA synthetase (AMP-forming)
LLVKWLGKRKEAFIESQGKVVALVEYENKSVKCQNLHQLLAKMSAMLGTLILYNCLFKNNDESASDSGEISTPTSASRTKLSQHMVLKSYWLNHSRDIFSQAQSIAKQHVATLTAWLPIATQFWCPKIYIFES